MINQDFTSVELPLVTDFETIAVSVHLPRTKLTICNIYIPNNRDFSLDDIERIIQQLPNSFILVGDFNSHSETWGSYKSDHRGKIIDELLTKDNLMLLNIGYPTKINPVNELSSIIDLSITNTSFRIDYSGVLYHIPSAAVITSPYKYPSTTLLMTHTRFIHLDGLSGKPIGIFSHL
jgi:hypothetical protein